MGASEAEVFGEYLVCLLLLSSFIVHRNLGVAVFLLLIHERAQVIDIWMSIFLEITVVKLLIKVIEYFALFGIMHE